MTYLKLAAVILLVVLIGVPAASAQPDGEHLNETPSTRLNLDYLAPEARSFFGPDTYLASVPGPDEKTPLDPTPSPEPRYECGSACDRQFHAGLRGCFARFWPDDAASIIAFQECRAREEGYLQTCKMRCGQT